MRRRRRFAKSVIRFGSSVPHPVSNDEARAIAVRLSRRMTAILVEHGAGPQPVLAGRDHWNTVIALRNRHLLKVHATVVRPRETMATSLGRQVIAAALAIEADKLVMIELFREEALIRETTTPAEIGPRRSVPVRS